jgi:exodeoxyribonuclease V alpha subunit
MTPVTSTIDRLHLEPAAHWFGERLCRTLSPEAMHLLAPVAWSLHQWMQGHTCLDLAGTVTAPSAAAGSLDTLEASVPDAWLEVLGTHPAVARAAEGSMHSVAEPLVLEGTRLFLGRWRRQEIEVATALLQRARRTAAWCDTPQEVAAVEAFAASRGSGLHAAQSRAVRVGATRRLAVVTGGPGTGKTFAAARVIEAVLETGPHPVLLLAPTGKAAARLQASVRAAAAEGSLTPVAAACMQGLQAQTMHAATMRQGGEALRRARLIVVDETSMIDMERMHELLRLAHVDASVLLLGDPHQLASVEAGSVLADIVHGTQHASHPLSGCVVRLEESRRFAPESAVARLAAAVNGGDPDQVMRILKEAPEGLVWKPATTPRQVVEESIRAMGDRGEGVRILCGHRRGPDGSLRINAALERGLGRSAGRPWYEGRPILVTVNDDLTGLRNGDTGRLSQRQGAWFAHFDGDVPPVPVSRLPAHETAYALTIHKTQGSEYERVIVALPARPSPVLTRELLYTGITRTRSGLVVVGSEETIRAAVARPIARSSGLRARLRAGLGPSDLVASGPSPA